MKRHLLTLYTRTPLHVGSGTSVDVVDLPIMRERITGFPVIPATSLKGVLRQWSRDACKQDGSPLLTEDEGRTLFGEDRRPDEKAGITSYAGCIQIMEAKLLAFPVRSLAGCFAWLTCPAALERFKRDTNRRFTVPTPAKDKAAVPGDSILTIPGQTRVVLEEFALDTLPMEAAGARAVAEALRPVCSDPLWAGSLVGRLAVLNDENFQHFACTCTEVVARIKIDPATRTVHGGALFNQENIPCEALFYTVLTVLPPRRNGIAAKVDPNAKLAELLPDGANPAVRPPILQIGGDETTGHGLCETKREVLP